MTFCEICATFTKTEYSRLCDSLQLSVLFHVINLLAVQTAKQKVRKCSDPIFHAETIKAVLILSNTYNTRSWDKGWQKVMPSCLFIKGVRLITSNLVKVNLDWRQSNVFQCNVFLLFIHIQLALRMRFFNEKVKVYKNI